MSAVKNCYCGTCKEKSSFTMTFNRLSSFLKEKASLRDIRINKVVSHTIRQTKLFREKWLNRRKLRRHK
ncbi:hypothetical protein Hanom_Chr12g01078981 [Helianthus anomalus]